MKRLKTPRAIRKSAPRRERPREQGQIIVLFVFALIVILGTAALAIDVGLLRNANQNLWNALDAGALAGAQVLPDDPAAAEALALQYAEENFPGDLPTGVTPTFRCIVGAVGGNPRPGDVPAVCDPGPNAAWTCNAKICASVCMPYAPENDICNAITLESTASIPYRFGPAVGVTTGTTKDVVSAACKGACGTRSAEPVDLVLLVDRTPSMDSTDIENARRAADSVRSSSSNNPAEQWMAMGLIGPAEANNVCQPDDTIVSADPNSATDMRRWIPVPLSGIGAPLNQNYKNSGSAMANALLVSCFQSSPGDVATDLADPFDMAIETLAGGRSDATKGIILMTDGQPNHSNAHRPSCSSPSSVYDAEAIAAAAVAKSQGIEVFTIGFGLGPGEIHGSCGGPGWSTTGQETRARQLLAAMASPDADGNPAQDNGCSVGGVENDDGDHFFCIPKSPGASANLADLFKQAVNQLIGGTRLVQLPA